MSTKEDQQTASGDAGANAIAIRSLDDITKVSKIFVHSGMFPGDRGQTAEQQIYQAVVKVMAGVEFGIQPFAAMRGINIIQGKAEMSANLMAAQVKKHPQYDYRVDSLTSDGCTISFYEIVDGKRDKLGESSFTREDANRAGLNGGNWTKFPRNMFFARAMSNGVRLHCPDVFYGAPVYVEGEIGGDADNEARTIVEAAEKPTAVEGEIVQADDPIIEEIEQEARAEEAEAEGGDDPESLDGGTSQVADHPETGESLLLKLNRDIAERLDELGYTSAVAKKAFITRVLGHSVAENEHEADLVNDHINNESEEAQS